MSTKLLLVEDNASTRASLLETLAATPFVVSCANDGLDGLNQAKATPFDVVLIDHKMPLMDGLSLIRTLRTLPAYAQTPLILLSTQDSSQLDEMGQRSGADLSLAKPVDGQRLLELLADLWQTMQTPKQSAQI
ncbi:Transcriptional activator protein CzcR [Pseudidiomarina piscicola]|uniref:Transcriptional activator protein CzcR n=1 Tax=Pseudidiomarina piscicola TaxID=2614830 RepID=A0A6S6WKF8_9GAMM|nr:response regulator [Pseudidiomarina piscicola]CAB0149673.1 Transcriptional activator protein CzcR [Pseudidiomarina piscicola]VZT39122.1 Transcriptional activator protein CzcR [Pseudomonas aeruginosa]